LSSLAPSDLEDDITEVSNYVRRTPASRHRDDLNDIQATTLSASGPPLTLVANNGSFSEVFDSPTEQNCSPETFDLPHDRQISLDRPLPLYFSGQAPATILLRHYMENMVYLMQPVSHRRNPFKTIYLNTALEGCRDSASPETSAATVSVYHSVLAAAAIHLQWSTPQETSYLNQMACYHRQEALKAARSALNDKKCTYKAVMTAVLSLVSVDVSAIHHPFRNRR
jgi:arginine metabolism regulation protein II